MPPLHLLYLENLPIFKQLQIEEALLRADERNWCLINQGALPAIVFGISGKISEHLSIKHMKEKPIPIIRRFSGGGTVIVDEHTLFFTLIGNHKVLDCPCYPEMLLKWTEKLYFPAFKGINFSLRDNDYVIENKKFGGNAQYLTKDRWLHHTSLLWDYKKTMMDYLLMPPKEPSYRQRREHSQFLCRLSEYFPNQEIFKNQMIAALKKRFTVIETPIEAVESLLKRPHRQATKFETYE